ncbi:S1 family peptidase [Comamonas sp. J-3]|uniref:S1 family peptidase n=1 Tax=Comamonas trifloxystrobinivorans TaxID=3350256 RepID=UPI00372B4272
MKNLAFAIFALSVNAVYAEEGLYTSRSEAMKGAGLEAMMEEKNVLLLKNAQAEYETYKNKLGDDFGGMWIDYDDGGNPTIHIGVVDYEAINKVKAGVVYGVPTKVEYSLDVLNATKELIANSYYLDRMGDSKEYSYLLSTYVDIPGNKVIVTSRADDFDKLKKWLKSKDINLEMMGFVEQDGPVSLHARLVGGDAIFSGQANNLMGCTSGFNVTIDGYITGAMTAGHCALGGQGVYFNRAGNPATGIVQGPYIGAYLANEYNSGVDAVLFGNENNEHELPNAIHTTTSYSEVPVRAVQSVESLIMGAPICRHGAVTLWKCGRLTAYSSSEFTGFYRPMNYALASFCGARGDSGGPVVTDAFPNMNAIGIYGGAKRSNQTNTCGASVGGGETISSIFTPVSWYLARYPNVRIKTSQP